MTGLDMTTEYQEEVQTLNRVFYEVQSRLLEAYKEQQKFRIYKPTLAAGKFSLWISETAPKDYDFIFNTIKNKNVQVDELDWTTCSRKSLPRLHAWEPIEGYTTMTIGNLMGEKECTGGLVIRDGVGNVGKYLSVLLSTNWKIHQAKLITILKGLHWSSAYLEKVEAEKKLRVKTDYWRIVRTLNSRDIENIMDNKTTNIYRAIFKVIDDKFDACEFSYIPKEMNQLANLLASNYQLPEKKRRRDRVSSKFEG
ncbi:hypothetical protein CCACVL1_12258 [Corchorus capsularis]|uniref:RNase H type-1 domain-containing protein n=1 Tax=Corchorus capsularis TaxID=210143 RepID=A0A1R3IGL3_COCAP|nr:hypothetical protein CCACVL1_12258 [Corchorus capsularis]